MDMNNPGDDCMSEDSISNVFMECDLCNTILFYVTGLKWLVLYVILAICMIVGHYI